MITNEQIAALLDSIPELEESKIYYEECLSAVNGLINAITMKMAKLPGNATSDEQSLTAEYLYDINKLRLERCDLMATKKAYESYLTTKAEALIRNRQMEVELQAECNGNFDVFVDKIKNSNNPKQAEIKGFLNNVNLATLSPGEKLKMYLKLKWAVS